MKIEKLVKETLYHNKLVSLIFHTSVYCLKRELKNCQSVLDLGCGPNSPVQYCHLPYSVGVEAFKPYLIKTRNNKIHHRYIFSDVTKIKFKPKSFDAVIMIDVLEHLKKEEGLEMLKKMEFWARKKIILSTPDGFLTQSDIDYNYFQIHRSGWTVKEFKKMGFKVYGLAGLKSLRGRVNTDGKIFTEIKFRPWFFWLIISELTQLLTYHFPELAFNIFCVKSLEK